jgi:diguanylate cyclase (GGDEF)-like protein
MRCCRYTHMDAGGPSDQARMLARLRRWLWVSRGLGVLLALAVGGTSLYIHRADPTSTASVVQLVETVVALAAFVGLATVTRRMHAGMLERSLADVTSLSEQLRDLAERDPLTGLYNLRAFYRRLDDALADSQEAGTPVALVIADLDDFKPINDTYGHRFGDEVLQAMAQVLREHLPAGAFAARPGGDEFAIVLPRLGRDAVMAFLDRVASALSALEVEGRQVPAMASFGAAVYPADARSASDLFAAADAGMYDEKRRRKRYARAAA